MKLMVKKTKKTKPKSNNPKGKQQRQADTSPKRKGSENSGDKTYIGERQTKQTGETQVDKRTTRDRWTEETM